MFTPALPQWRSGRLGCREAPPTGLLVVQQSWGTVRVRGLPTASCPHAALQQLEMWPRWFLATPSQPVT